MTEPKLLSSPLKSIIIQFVLSSKAPGTMDKLESLSSTLQNITLYDIKSMYNQVSSR